MRFVNMKKEEILRRKELVKKLGKTHTPKEVSKLSGISYITTLKYFKELELSLEGSGGKNRIINFNPFIGDDVSDYWLGFLAADGHVSGNQIGFTQKDEQILNDYNKFFRNKLNLYRGKRAAPMYVFSNKEIAEYLISEGVTPKKSRTLELKRINSSIVRGLFDGDGSARKQVKFTSGSEKLIIQLEEELKDYNTYIKSKKEALDLIIRDIPAFYWYLYTNAEVYMTRKRKDFGQLSRKTRLKIGDELLESLLDGNQQPSLSRNTLEGSTTRSRHQNGE